MTVLRELPVEIEPELWNVVFHRTAIYWWHHFLPGPYKHVSAFAYIAPLDLWIVYDVWKQRTRIVLMPHCTRAEEALADYSVGADILQFRSCAAPGIPFAAFSCVSAIKHLLGIRPVAATPTGLYRWLLKHGGEPYGRTARDAESRPAGSSAA